MSAITHEPRLAAPGSGISWFEMAMLNYVLKPFSFRNAASSRALNAVRDSALRLEDMLGEVPEKHLTTRVLVSRPSFVEDSSRHWSAAMLFRHLAKVNFAMARAIETGFTATRSQLPPPSERLTAVKPELERNEISAIEEFRKSVDALAGATAKRSEDELRTRSVAHPWLGDITHLQWLWFIAFHHRVHARQLERIISGLDWL